VSSTSVFYFDLASPPAYFAAERVLQVLPAPTRWQPVLAASLPAADTFDAWRCGEEAEVFRAEAERRAGELGLQRLRWPDPFPFDSERAMRAATYAASIGRAVPFAQAAFRQAFAGGHSLADADYVLIAAAACEMHPTAVKQAMERDTIGAQLASATADARDAGVTDVPAIVVAGRVFTGERELERAAAHMLELEPAR
jgi:2-hydroxychromene-2-carboxylate isomerase